MNIAFYTGTSGMIAYQQDMDIIAHNIANVNTTGYKTQRAVFSDLLYSRMAVNTEENFMTGHGIKVADSDLIFQQGPVLPTQNPLDFGIIGAGFFALQTGEGSGRNSSAQLAYTRNGAFGISVDGNTGTLVSADGAFVLGSDGNKITLTRSTSDGPFDLTSIVNRLGVYQFPNPFGLEPASGGRFLQTEKSGEAQSPQQASTAAQSSQELPYRIISSALESSSVNLADEMVMVIQSQRAFQFSARLVQTADDLEEIVNNLR